MNYGLFKRFELKIGWLPSKHDQGYTLHILIRSLVDISSSNRGRQRKSSMKLYR